MAVFVGFIDPYVACLEICDMVSQDALDSLKIGDNVTYYTEIDPRLSARKCKGKTKTIQTQTDIINLKLKFRENQIFEVRKA